MMWGLGSGVSDVGVLSPEKKKNLFRILKIFFLNYAGTCAKVMFK